MAVAILLTACITVFATGKKPGATPPKKVDYQISFNRIVVADDIDLQLIESNDKFIEITGDNAAIEKVDWKISKNVLYIKSKKESLKDKVTVTVNVNQLKELMIKGKSVINSQGALLSPSLHVYMTDDSYVAIKSAGQIRIMNSSDTQLDVRRIVGDVQFAIK
ncbi:MAG: hypothetical protein JWP81_3900 [Ferruginibacter sp.]|nr:hypothetical protein [Ferruginibacter sp.]